ncbi:hypothetical protein [Flagellimonas onchidii]|uniref:hypothetical protein n=1 Tax=Flagellimonas onchidii TaxID=2562684 RepID=UPI0010A64E93|nr:hypothetical protein [Allomuricauda onchidii]
MGGGGHILHMVRSFKANRDLLKKRRRKSKEDVYGMEARTELSFKKSTPEDIMVVRKKIAHQKRKNSLAGLMAILIMIIFAFITYWLLSR